MRVFNVAAGWICLWLAILGVSLLSGCGAGSSAGRATSADRSGPSSGLGALLIARADAICARLNTEILARENTVPAASEGELLREIERVVPGTAALERKAAADLASLAVPPTLAGTWQRIISYRQMLAAELDALVTAAKHDDTAAIAALKRSKKRAHGLLRQIASQSGFKDCGEVGPSSKPPAKRSPS